MLELDGKKGISLEIYQFWHNEMIFKDGKTAYHGQRWIAETVFSSIKRMFGEYVYSVRLKNMIQEMMLKASLYNKIIYLNKFHHNIEDYRNHATKHEFCCNLFPLET
jgi:hypothetical protein